jgi:rubrerythrin
MNGLNISELMEQLYHETAKAEHYHAKGWYKIYHKQMKVVYGIQEKLLKYEDLLKSKN